MIQQETRLHVADNSGAKELGVIRVLGGTRARYARVGDIVTASVKEASPTGNVKKKLLSVRLLSALVAGLRRPDGSTIRFDDNAAVIVNDDKLQRVLVSSASPRELRDLGYNKIISLAPEVL